MLVGGDGELLGGRGRVLRALRGGRERETRAPPRGAAAVTRLVGDDPQQPRPERLLESEPPERTPGLDDGLLRGVLGLGGVPGNDVGESEQYGPRCCILLR